MWDKNRRHRYIIHPVTGKARRIFPRIDVLRVSNGEEIGPDNVEWVARKILQEVEEFSGVDETQLNLLRARKSGMWNISFEQIHRGFKVYGARYGITIGRHNTVLSIGGDVYDVTMTGDLEVQPTITSCQVAKCLLGNSGNAEIMDNPTLMIYPDVQGTDITYKMAWVASVDDGGDTRKVVVDAFSGEILVSESLVVF